MRGAGRAGWALSCDLADLQPFGNWTDIKCYTNEVKTLLETAAIRFTGTPRMLICPNCLSLTKHKVFQEADCVTVLGVPIARRLRREVLECEDCGDTHEVPGILAASGLERAGSSANAGAATRSPVMRVLAIAGIGVLTLAALIALILLIPRLG